MQGPAQALEFPPFRLERQEKRLWRGKRPVELRPKTWELLQHLAEHPGRLLSKDELLDAVWGDVEVGPGSLNQAILELRQALGDDARKPRFIETVHRRGFRFIAAVQQPAVEARQRSMNTPLPGRESELEQLDACLQEARAGRRQIVFATGEPGIGKTRLVREFCERLAEDDSEDRVWVAGGRCVELYGEGEAYLPFLEALEALAREAGAGPLRRTLRQWAPSWLAQLSWLQPRGQSTEPHSMATPPRMLRELCSALEALAAERPLVLWLEDLHWSDLSTLDLLAGLAARSEPARLLILVTYRPVDAAMGKHPIGPLKRTLVQRDGCRELALELLDELAVRACLRQRFTTEFEPGLPALIHEQTDGNPLFMNTVLDYLVGEGQLARADGDAGWSLTVPIDALPASVPESLSGIVESQLDRMNAEDVEVLTAASAVGETFPTQLVGAALGREVLAVEKVCGRLAGWRRFLDAAGAGHWADGSAGERYRFQHAVYRSILYRRLAAAQRQELHHRIATRLEEGHPGEPRALAAQLALHFERGGDRERAIPYLMEAATGVRERAGDREAVAYFDHALALLASLPESADRDRRELELRMQLWREVNASGFASAVGQDASLERALELCARTGDARSRAYAASYLTRSLIIECELDAAESAEEQRVELATSLGEPVLLAAAHGEIGDIAFYRGELDRAERELAPCLSALEGVDPPESCRALGHDPATLALGRLGGWTHWLQGRPDEARRDAAACLSRAEACRHPLNRAFALGPCELTEQFRRDVDAAELLAKSLAELVEKYGFDFPQPLAYALVGWRLAQRGDIDEAIAAFQEGVAVSHRTRVREASSLLLAVLAETELLRGNAKEGLAAIEEARAFVEETGERFWEAEIHRLEGELLRLDGGDESPEACFKKALDVARGQGARSLELRAATSLARLWKSGGRKDEARALLGPVYAGFSEGFDTLDLQEAKTLLDSL